MDAVLLGNTFHGVPEQTRLARAVAAILKPGGLFAVINWHREQTTVLGQPRGLKTDMRMTPHDVATVVVPPGLIPTLLTELPPYHYASVFAKAAGVLEETGIP